jgi:hypothetical protein
VRLGEKQHLLKFNDGSSSYRQPANRTSRMRLNAPTPQIMTNIWRKRAGDTVNATVAAQSGHFVFINPGSSTWPHVVKTIRALMEPRP